jgi:SAM-dependent methyltransferase
MARIATQEQDTYERAWEFPAYAAHVPALVYLSVFLELVRARCDGLGSVLDAGCGTGQGALALQAAGFRVTCCDLTPGGLCEEARTLPFVQTPLWADLRPLVGFHDHVYCTDVLEHVPPEFTMLVLARLLAVARKGVFLSIALTPDCFGPWVGTALHQSVMPFTWWRDRMAELGEVVECRDLQATGLYWLQPR